MSNLQDIESERGFVGCLVAGQGDAFETCPATIEHFRDPLAYAIFQAAEGLRAEHAPVSGATVVHRIGLARIEELGGITAVMQACNSPWPAEAEYFFGAIDAKLTLRRGYNLGRWAQEQAEQTDDAQQYANELRKRCASVEATSEDVNGLETAIRHFEEKLTRLDSGIRETGLKTPVGAWNRLFGGILDGQMYGVAGRPGSGKTALMEMLICGALGEREPVCVFERDMSPQKLVERMACRMIGVPYWKLARGFVGREDTAKLRQAIDILREMPLHLHNPTNLTPERMCAIVRRDIRVHGIKRFFLDHIQTFGTGKDLREKLTSASLSIRDLVTTTGISAIILAHINRAGAKGRPTPEDIKEFDQLYGDSDAMLMLWTEKDKAELEPGEILEVNFYAAKNRDAAVAEEKMGFQGDTMKFVELAQ